MKENASGKVQTQGAEAGRRTLEFAWRMGPIQELMRDEQERQAETSS